MRFSPGCECCCDGCCLKNIQALTGGALPPGTLVNGGAGYASGDTVTIAGGTHCVQAVLVVNGVSPGGVITGLTVSDPRARAGQYSVVPPNPATQQSTSGNGTGAAFNLDWSSCCPCGADDTNKGCSAFQVSLPGCGDVSIVSQGLDAGGQCTWSGTCDDGSTITLQYCATNHTWTLTAKGMQYVNAANVCPPFNIGPASVSADPSPTFQVASTFNHPWWYCSGNDRGCIQNTDLSGTIALQPLTPTDATSWFGSLTYEEPCNCFIGTGCCGSGPACAGNCLGPPGGTKVLGNSGCLVTSWASFVAELAVQLTRSPTPCPCDPNCPISWQVTITLLIGGIQWCQLQGTATSTATPGQPLAVPAAWTQAAGQANDCWWCPDQIALDFSMFTFS